MFLQELGNGYNYPGIAACICNEDKALCLLCSASVARCCCGLGAWACSDHGAESVAESGLAAPCCYPCCGHVSLDVPWVLIILERERFTWIFLLTFLLSYIGWVVLLNVPQPQNRIPILYVVTGIVLIVLCSASSIWAFDFLCVIWLALYPIATPKGTESFIKVTRVEDTSESVPQVTERSAGALDAAAPKMILGRLTE